MIGKFLPDWRFVVPLLAHVGVHAGFTFVIVCCWTYGRVDMALCLALFDAAIHFFMDRLKAGPKYLGRWKALSGKEWPAATDEQKRGNKLYYFALGFDQMVHALTHYAIIAMILCL